MNSFLVFLEQASPESIVVAATNHHTILDRALFRRFDMMINYSLPSANEAGAVMKARLGPMGKGIDWTEITPHAVGLSHAELVKAAETAAKKAIMRDDSQVTVPDMEAALDARRTANIA